MSRAPGYEKWPEHQIREEHVPERMTAVFGETVIADSTDVVRVNEDKHPVRLYFPRTDVNLEHLERRQKTSQCPFKGTAIYYSLVVHGQRLEDAAWSYEDPYDEHRALAGRIAFYEQDARLYVGVPKG